MSESSGMVSLSRLVKVVLPLLAVALLVRYVSSGYEQQAQQALENDILTILLGDSLQPPSDSVALVDADGDLLCDTPADAQAPEKLYFSYIAGPDPDDAATTWAGLVEAIATATGLPVEYQHYENTNDQLGAMARGELHLAGLNTGAVPMAVQAAGFHPVATFGHDDDSFGYTMQLIVPTASQAQSPADLRGAKVAFTRPDSNSGFKAALIHLMTDEGLYPERDYQWGWTYGHETSIREAVAGSVDVAAVASDILTRMTTDGDIDAADVRVLYESERFPPATLGHSHNLPGEIQQQISEAILGFAWQGSGVAEKYASAGVSHFVPVTYKDDWANIRRIDEAVRTAKSTR